MSQASPASCRRAMITPPIASIGAEIIRVAETCTSICTCCTSFVLRVISDGAPNCPTSRCENATTRWKRSPRSWRPIPIARRDPKYTAMMAQITWTRLTPSIMTPVCRM